MCTGPKSRIEHHTTRMAHVQACSRCSASIVRTDGSLPRAHKWPAAGRRFGGESWTHGPSVWPLTTSSRQDQLGTHAAVLVDSQRWPCHLRLRQLFLLINEGNWVFLNEMCSTSSLSPLLLVQAKLFSSATDSWARIWRNN
jgi:hypothetical protein